MKIISIALYAILFLEAFTDDDELLIYNQDAKNAMSQIKSLLNLLQVNVLKSILPLILKENIKAIAVE